MRPASNLWLIVIIPLTYNAVLTTIARHQILGTD